MSKRTYVDSCLLIAAYQGTQDLSNDAIAVLDDPERRFVVSSYVELEVLPKARFHNKVAEVDFMQQFLEAATERIEPSQQIADDAILLAATYDLSPVDALHASVAKAAKVDEFVTLEGANKPLLRVQEANVVTLRK